MTIQEKYKDTKFIHKVILVVFFLLFIIYGFAIRPVFLDKPAIALEIVMLIITTFCMAYLMIFAKVTWKDIESEMQQKVGKAVPILAILLSIGVLVGSLIMSGVIPMLIYYGIKFINPRFLYVVSFLLPIVFSMSTGTSWGSAATIGVVLMSIAIAIDANLAITAGAVIGGSYFGDKMSPISDTTNLAALATDVNLYDHVRAMFWTTIPTALIAIVLYVIFGFIYPPAITDIQNPEVQQTLLSLKGMFNFNLLLLLPIITVIYGSYTKKPPLLVMMGAAIVGYILVFIFQNFSLDAIFRSIGTGFSREMITWYTINDSSQIVIGFLERGGFWTFGSIIPQIITILLLVATLGIVNAVPAVVECVFAFAKTRFQIIASTISTTAVVLGASCNGIATTFIVADTFKQKFDDSGIDRRVLSRSIEDAGTMLDPLYVWTPASIFFVNTLGVPVSQFLPWAFMNWGTIIVAFVIAFFGIGCYPKVKKD